MKNREKNTDVFDIKALNLLKPETALERSFISCHEFMDGLKWGVPRYGHPEGKVLYHIREVLDNVEIVSKASPLFRKNLRIITFVHDTFKYKEDKSTQPRDWSKHHGMIARKYLENLTDQQNLLDIVELHDEAYHCWRMHHLHNENRAATIRLNHLLQRLGDSLQLYYLFFKCDTRTGDKVQAPVTWFEQTIKDIDILEF